MKELWEKWFKKVEAAPTKDGLTMKGRVRVIDKRTGMVLREVDNLVVNAGVTHVRDRVSGLATVPDAMSHVAVGTDNTAATGTDTTLGTEIDRQASVVTEPDSYELLHTATFGAGDGTGAWTEAGIFNDASAGTMLARVTFSVVNKGASDEFDIEWTITFSDDGV